VQLGKSKARIENLRVVLESNGRLKVWFIVVALGEVQHGPGKPMTVWRRELLPPVQNGSYGSGNRPRKTEIYDTVPIISRLGKFKMAGHLKAELDV
jgi:hypothetical protein